MPQTQTPDNHADNGIFITLEGGEGVGKTTHVRFLADALRSHGREVICVREPGGTAIGEKLRSILLDPANDALVDEAELLIYEAARAQIVAEVIRPALERGAVVLCDRFSDSTVAYQAYGRGLPFDFVEQANDFATQGLHPDRTIILVAGASPHTGLMRATHQSAADRVERAGEEFHARVNEGFLRIAAAHPQRICVVSSDECKSTTAAALFYQLSDLFPWMADPEECNPEFFAPLDVRRAHLGRSASEAASASELSPTQPASGPTDAGW